MRWPPRNRVSKLSRRELPRKIKKDGTPYKKANYEYQCNLCKEWFRSSDTEMDHIEEVMEVSSRDMSEAEYYGHFIIGLLCYDENWQRCCTSCHDKKTKAFEQKVKKKLDK